jgi:hypothetical protein
MAGAGLAGRSGTLVLFSEVESRLKGFGGTTGGTLRGDVIEEESSGMTTGAGRVECERGDFGFGLLDEEWDFDKCLPVEDVSFVVFDVDAASDGVPLLESAADECETVSCRFFSFLSALAFSFSASLASFSACLVACLPVSLAFLSTLLSDFDSFFSFRGEMVESADVVVE